MISVLKGAGIILGSALVVTAFGSSSDAPTPTPSQNVVETAPVKSSTTAPATPPVTNVVESTTEVAKPVVVPTPKPTAAPKPTSNCHPSYSGCLKMNAGDYDCAGGSGNGPNYTGAVRVYGSDPFDLDRDNDGWGCE